MPRQKSTGKRRAHTPSGRRSATWWEEQPERWAGSGLSKAACCAANGLNPASLYQWSRHLRHREPVSGEPRPPAAKQSSPFVQVVLEPEASPAAAACKVSFAETSLSFPGGLQPGDLLRRFRHKSGG